MFDNLTLRNKLLAVSAIPTFIFILVALLAGFRAGDPLVAMLAVVGAVATIAFAQMVAKELTSQAESAASTLQELTSNHLPRIVATVNEAGIDPVVMARSLVGRPDGDDEDWSFDAAGSPEDEIRQLTRGIGQIGPAVAELLVDQQEKINRRLGQLVQGLARRHQSLLDRQIEHIDWLEDTEQAPDRLEQLFKLDHLATRLRRSSETVLVLAGGESTRPRGGPAPVATVLRVAMGETEAYTKIRLRSVDEALIAGGPAFDLAHLLSELLENATQFSPPETPVEVHASRLGDGGYQITIVDRGVGMDGAKLALSNETIANPPDLDLAMGRSIGFIVIGRLAGRIGATVDLAQTPGSGITATVVVPAFFVLDPGQEGAQPGQGQAQPALPGGSEPGTRPVEIPQAPVLGSTPPLPPGTSSLTDPVEFEPDPEPRLEFDLGSESSTGPDVEPSWTELLADPPAPMGSDQADQADQVQPDEGDWRELLADPDPVSQVTAATPPPAPLADPAPVTAEAPQAGLENPPPSSPPPLAGDPSSALSKLLGLPADAPDLTPSQDWSAPPVQVDQGAPLTSRPTQGPPVPPALGGPSAAPDLTPSWDWSDSPSPTPSPESSQHEAPAPLTPSSPPGSLDQALPSGPAFESGIESLLDSDPASPPPLPPPAPPALDPRRDPIADRNPAPDPIADPDPLGPAWPEPPAPPAAPPTPPSTQPEASAVAPPAPAPVGTTDPAELFPLPSTSPLAPTISASTLVGPPAPVPPSRPLRPAPANPEPANQEPTAPTHPGPAPDDEIWMPPTVTAGAHSQLRRRERGASSSPPARPGPRATASRRKPEEIRAMLDRYRHALKAPTGVDADDGASPTGSAQDVRAADPAPTSHQPTPTEDEGGSR